MRKIQLSFIGGEVSPELFGRLEDAKYQSGLATCRNFIIKPQGPAENRAGFEFVREVKNSAKRVRLIPFTYSTTQTMILEMGVGYFRFHTKGATLLKEGVPYELPHTYQEEDLFEIHYVQSADILTLVHPKHPPMELRRYGATDWRLVSIAFTPQIKPPTRVEAKTNSTADTKYSYSYVVTAISADGKSESVTSAVATCKGNLNVSGQWNTVSWEAVAGALRYQVYKLQGGIYGYIGHSSGEPIEDTNIAPDLSVTPPIYEQVFDKENGYPGAVSYFEQRRCFAGTINQPQHIWMTRSGTESDMGYSLPVKDDDRISFRVAAREANTIRHLVPLTHLLLLTSSAEWQVTAVNSDAITPATTSIRPQSYIGASNVQPLIINNTLLYGAARGGHIRELAYSWQSGGFITEDICLRGAHLFDNHTIIDMAYSKAPYPLVWFISSSGKLLGLTYVPEEQIGAWHWHDTQGVFESCAVVAEGKEDLLYCIIKRKINGREVRYLERMASRLFTELSDAFFVDAGLSYQGAPTAKLEGLAHLEGERVSILADGAVHPQQFVTGGAIVLDHKASKIHVGLPIEADLLTLPFSAQIDYAYAQGVYKNVNQAWLRVYRSSGVFIGPHEKSLVEAKQRTTEPYGSPPALKSEEIQINLTPSWSDAGQILIRQHDPLPLTVVNLTLEVTLGS